jgi:hypothetical protein
VHRETVQLHDGRGEIAARQMPRLARRLLEAGTMLAVGDWVLASREASGACWVQLRVPPLSHIVARDGDGSRHAVVSNVRLGPARHGSRRRLQPAPARALPDARATPAAWRRSSC